MLFDELEQVKRQCIGKRLLQYPWRQSFEKPALQIQIFNLSHYQMFARFMNFFHPLGLDPRSNNLDRMRDGSRDNATQNTGKHLIHFSLLQFLVQHVIETCEDALFDTRSNRPTEKTHCPFFLVDAFRGTEEALVLMEIRHFVAGFDYVERVCQEGADDPGR